MDNSENMNYVHNEPDSSLIRGTKLCDVQISLLVKFKRYNLFIDRTNYRLSQCNTHKKRDTREKVKFIDPTLR